MEAPIEGLVSSSGILNNIEAPSPPDILTPASVADSVKKGVSFAALPAETFFATVNTPSTSNVLDIFTVPFISIAVAVKSISLPPAILSTPPLLADICSPPSASKK